MLVKERRLIIMRHAKSSWSSNASSDHDRPLNNRGRRDAPFMAKVLRDNGWEPDLVLSSDSRRTRETWELMEEHLPSVKEVVFERTLYHAELKDLQSMIKRIKPRQGTILVLGHNPGWHEMVELLSGRDEKITTSNCALLSHDWGKWHELLNRHGNWTLHQVLRPKELRKSNT